MQPAARPRIVVHVGEPKTGTTFLQQVMWRNRGALAKQGVLLPGPKSYWHWRAAQDLRQVDQRPDDPAGPFAGAWDGIARKALTAPRVGVISHELLSAATPEQAARAVRSLARGEVHVVVSVRDIATLLPAEWQETVKHRAARTWDDWLGGVLEHEFEAADRRNWWFWKVHDTPAILADWAAEVPPERVHVLTVPPRGAPAGLLWERFAKILDVDPASVDLSAARGNASLGLAEVEMLRRLNLALADDVPDWFYMHEVKEALAHRALAGRPSSLGRLELPPERYDWAQRYAKDLVATLGASEYDIVGDLDELMPRPPSGHGADPAAVASDDMLDAAVAALSALVTQHAKRAMNPPAPSVRDALVAVADKHPALERALRVFGVAKSAAGRAPRR